MTGAASNIILWTDAEVRAALGATAGASGGWQARGVSIDSRSVAPGDLFFAIAGPNFDGHEFVDAALEAGAAAAVVSRDVPDLPGDAPLIRVDNTLEALAALGRAGRARMAGKVAAVTGSVGKTGTKEALRAAFDRFAPTQSTAQRNSLRRATSC